MVYMHFFGKRNVQFRRNVSVRDIAKDEIAVARIFPAYGNLSSS
jgi:hypothetical protein